MQHHVMVLAGLQRFERAAGVVDPRLPPLGFDALSKGHDVVRHIKLTRWNKSAGSLASLAGGRTD
jgi:hypothetical protein